MAEPSRMRTAVLGAAGGLGRNVVDAALLANHEVRALVRNPASARLADTVRVVGGDARRTDDVKGVLANTEVAFFCVNPRFSRWLEDFPPILDAAIEACRSTSVRLVFPANVWVFGVGRPGEVVDEGCPHKPRSMRGRLRAEMEARLKGSGVRHCVVRLPEFYGPYVVSLTARVFQAVIRRRTVLWPGRLDAEVEFVYMPDAAKAVVTAGCARDADGETFHVPGGATTPRRFIEAISTAAGTSPRLFGIPPFALQVAGIFDSAVRGAADIAHLWNDPVMLDGQKYTKRFGEVPRTHYERGVLETLAWHLANPTVLLQG